MPRKPLDRSGSCREDPGIGGRDYASTLEWGDEVVARTAGVDEIVNAVGSRRWGTAFTAIGSGGEIAVMGKGAWIRGTLVGGAKAFEDLVAESTTRAPPPPRAGVRLRRRRRGLSHAGRGAFGKIMISGTA